MQRNCIYPGAAAHIRGGAAMPNLYGEAVFCQKPEGVLVKIQVSGLPADSQTGFFALHIHEGGTCRGTDFADTGGHYNPTGAPHPRHAGDLPPLLSYDGKATITVMTNRFTVREIIGKTVVIHSDADDFRSQPAGNAGTKIACGVIR